jgi:hypothetical protein
MSTAAGTNNIKSGLVLDLDPANTRSLTNPTRNVLAFPEDFTNAFWGKRSGCIVTPNVIAAPDGTMTADLVSVANIFYFPILFSGNASHSFHLKPAVGTNTFSLGHAGTGVSGTFNFTTKTFSGGYTGTYLDIGNGWYRVTFSTASQFANYYFEISFDNVAGVYIWGAQLEPSFTPSDYNPVSSSKTTTIWNDISGIPVSSAFTNLTQVELLVVAGGGGAVADRAGAGGAGGVIYNSAYPVTAGTSYTTTVAAKSSDVGNNSVFGPLTAIGGGRGGTGSGTAGGAGGSGGGGGNGSGADNFSVGGPGIPSQGFPGGRGFYTAPNYGTGGGGGAGGPGSDGGTSFSGNGGPGRYFPQFASVGGSPAGWFGGGGGGGSYGSGGINGIGGLGGGGTGSSNPVGGLPADSGVDNTGGGGGSSGNYSAGGAGGSGIIVVRYPEPQRATGGTVSLREGFVYHTFTSGTSAFITNTYINYTALVNGPTYSSTSTGILNFDGTDDYVITPFIPSNTAGSISVWFKLNLLKDFNTIFDNALGANDWEMWNFATGVTRFRTNNNETDFVVNSPVLAINTYYNITVTWNSTAATMYLNGVLVSQDTTPGTKVMPSYLYIGGGNAGNTKLNGSVGRVSIYDRVLTAAEILQNFNSMRGRYGI